MYCNSLGSQYRLNTHLRYAQKVYCLHADLEELIIFILCSTEDSDDNFDLIQPSLIKQLRKILDQYPDDGQILKVGYAIIYCADQNKILPTWGSQMADW